MDRKIITRYGTPIKTLYTYEELKNIVYNIILAVNININLYGIGSKIVEKAINEGKIEEYDDTTYYSEPIISNDENKRISDILNELYFEHKIKIDFTETRYIAFYVK